MAGCYGWLRGTNKTCDKAQSLGKRRWHALVTYKGTGSEKAHHARAQAVWASSSRTKEYFSVTSCIYLQALLKRKALSLVVKLRSPGCYYTHHILSVCVSIRYWGGMVPERCKQAHEGEEWNCFFGYRVFPSIKSGFMIYVDTSKCALWCDLRILTLSGWFFHFPWAGPVFVVQWLFDEAQLTVDNIQLTGQPVQEGQWRYIQNLGTELRNTLKDVP